MAWPDARTRDTQLWLDPGDSGKPRLRSLATPRYQIGRMMASMLLLPDPRRGRDVPGGQPIIRNNEYLLTKVGFQTDVTFADIPEQVLFTPSYIEVRNEDEVDQFGVAARWRRIESVYPTIPVQGPKVAAALGAHRDFMASGQPITGSLNTIVRNLRKALAEADAAYDELTDPLPILELRAGITPPSGPELPSPDDVGEEDAEVRIRSAHDYRLSKSRGPSARAFAKAVRDAYRHRCLFCGVILGGFGGLPSGVDAAHILAWTNYDLDVVSNGMALCRLHHWAFDAALMVPVIQDGKYVVRFTSRASEVLAAEALPYLGHDGFEIPEAWLPADRSQWPNKKYLTRLYDDLSIVLA
jgi:putative restriction endonuclease